MQGPRIIKEFEGVAEGRYIRLLKPNLEGVRPRGWNCRGMMDSLLSGEWERITVSGSGGNFATTGSPRGSCTTWEFSRRDGEWWLSDYDPSEGRPATSIATKVSCSTAAESSFEKQVSIRVSVPVRFSE